MINRIYIYFSHQIRIDGLIYCWLPCNHDYIKFHYFHNKETIAFEFPYFFLVTICFDEVSVSEELEKFSDSFIRLIRKSLLAIPTSFSFAIKKYRCKLKRVW